MLCLVWSCEETGHLFFLVLKGYKDKRHATVSMQQHKPDQSLLTLQPVQPSSLACQNQVLGSPIVVGSGGTCHPGQPKASPSSPDPKAPHPGNPPKHLTGGPPHKQDQRGHDPIVLDV